MKKLMVLALAVLMVLSFAACGSKDGGEENTWARVGSFQDENGNFLSITESSDKDNPGYYVGCLLGDEMHGAYIQMEGDALHGDLISDEEGSGIFIVTVTEEGEDGIQVVVENGETYHMVPMEMVAKEDLPIEILLSTEGMGQIAFAEEGKEPEFNEEEPTQSARLSLADTTVYALDAKADEGWHFVRWMKNGEEYSLEAQTTAEFSESAEYTAVFEVDEEADEEAAAEE